MLSSWQIAQQHAQQSQQFGAQQAYSQQLSSMMPQPYGGGGLGATGMGGGFGQDGAYSYGRAMSGSYGPGNSFGNRMTSAVGGFGHAMGAGAGVIGAGIGYMGGGISGAMTGFGIGGFVGSGIQHVAGGMMEGAHEQAAMERTLSQFQFQNGASRTGKGFSRNDSMQIGNMVRQMERMPEMLTSFGELNRVMDKMGQMGLMQGVRDAGDFMRKFRDTVNTVKDLSKVIGTTMEGALQAFGESRMSGFYSKADIVKNVLNRQVTGAVTGMSQEQVAGLQQFGADMGHATGGSRRSGAKNMIRTANQLGMANQMGILTNDQIMEMTGKEGAEGIQDLSASMGQLSYKMANSNVGQALTLALGKQKDGRYTGEMDEDLVAKVRSGELSLSELKGLARSKAGSRGAKLSFAAHKDRLRSEMAGAVGAEGMGMQLNEILGSRGWSNPDAQNLVMQRFGASEEQANLLQQMMPNLQSIGSEMGLATSRQGRQSSMNAVNKEHGWDAIKARIGKKLSHYTTDWAKDLGVSVRNYFQNWADDFLDDLSGEYRTTLTKGVVEAARGGGKGMSSMMNRANTFAKGMSAGDFSIGGGGGLSGLAARGMHALSGDESKGERALKMMRAVGMGNQIMTSGAGGIGDFMMGGMGKSMDNRARMAGGQMRLSNDEYVDPKVMAEMEHKYATLDSNAKSNLDSIKTKLGPEGFATLMKSYEDVATNGNYSNDPAKRQDAIMSGLGTAYGKTLKASNAEAFLSSDTMSGAMSLFGIGGVSKQAVGMSKQARGFDEVLKKTGMSTAEIVTAISSGSKLRGGVSGSQLGGGMDSFTNLKEASNKIRDIDRSMGKRFGGSDTEAGWADLKKYLDDGGDMGTLFAGKDGKGGLMRGDMDLRKILAATSPSDWTAEQKEKLKSMGINVEKLASTLSTPQGRENVDKMVSAAGKMTSGDASSIESYQNAQAYSGIKNIEGSYANRRAGAQGRLRDDNTKESLDTLRKGGGAGNRLLGLLNTNAGAAYGSDNTAELVSALQDSSPELMRAGYRAMSDEGRAVFDFDKGTRGKIRGHRGALTSQGIIDEIGGDVDKETRAGIEGILGKSGKYDGSKSELDKLMSLLDKNQSIGKTIGKGGTELKNNNVSEAEVGASLKSLVESTTALAEVVKKLQTDKDKPS